MSHVVSPERENYINKTAVNCANFAGVMLEDGQTDGQTMECEDRANLCHTAEFAIITVDICH